jgi:hypothetical protein
VSDVLKLLTCRPEESEAAMATHCGWLASNSLLAWRHRCDWFGTEIDYAMLVKYYGEDTHAEKRYSPAVCTGCEKVEISGSPDPKHISTSHVERSNLTMRMHMRRFTRLTNAFTKKVENHAHMVALYTVWYSFIRSHKTLKSTPAVAAKIADRAWTLAEIVELMDQVALVPAAQPE